MDSVRGRVKLSGAVTHSIDTPARPAADEIKSLADGCDLIILPTSPEPLSLGALAQIANTLPKGANYRVLLTMVPPKPQKDGLEALAALERYSLPTFKQVIRQYKTYVKASDQGLPINKIWGGGIAWSDWKALWKELKDVI